MARTTIPLLLLFLFSTHKPQAQADYTADSLRLARAEWRTDSLDGFTLKRYNFGEGALFCSAQRIYLIEMPQASHRRLVIAADSTTLTVDSMAMAHGAAAAVNGSFFDMRTGQPVCFLRVDGRQLGENTPQTPESVNRKYYQHATLALDSLGRPLLMVPDSNRRWEESLPHSDVMTAGPMLLKDGVEVPQRDDRIFVTNRYNRTALGLRADGTVLLLVADGLVKHKAEGLTLPELARLMRWLGCTDAINLDGGGSSTIYVRDATPGGVLNHPTDNKRDDHNGQRRVSNAILVL